MRTRPLPPVGELLADLVENGVTDAPQEGPDEARLQGLLDMALFVATHGKRVAFPDFSWTAPAFSSHDAHVDVTLRYATLESLSEDHLRRVLLAHAPHEASPGLVALDARPSGITEYQLTHHLYGQVTLFQFPHKPVESADLRIHQAREAGWTKTLKDHNLLPGRGLVVLDEHQGLLLRDPDLVRVAGLLVLLPSGQVELLWNPFAQGLDPDMQHWLTWGPGAPPRAWKEILHVREGEE